MPKKTSAKGRTKTGATKRKLLDLPVKKVKGGDATSVKGGGSLRYIKLG